MVHIDCMIMADCVAYVSAPAALATMPINKHHTAVMWLDVIFVSCLGLGQVIHKSSTVGVCHYRGTLDYWNAQVERLLADLVWTIRLGLHLVYTRSTPCLHLVYRLQPCSMFIRTHQMASFCRKGITAKHQASLDRDFLSE